MSEQATPVFQIQRVYLKDLSLEQPNSPAILLQQEQPNVDIQLGVEATPVAEGVFEVAVTATVQTKIEDKTLFLVEAKQAGIFEIRNIPEEQMGGVIGVACPQIVYPYLRASVADIIYTLQRHGHQYYLVVDRNEHHIRGVVSSAEISRRLHKPVLVEKIPTVVDILSAVRG